MQLPRWANAGRAEALGPEAGTVITGESVQRSQWLRGCAAKQPQSQLSEADCNSSAGEALIVTKRDCLNNARRRI